MEMNKILNIDLNWFEISENEIENVIGEVNKEMKLDGWILIELKNEECLIVKVVCKRRKKRNTRLYDRL